MATTPSRSCTSTCGSAPANRCFAGAQQAAPPTAELRVLHRVARHERRASTGRPGVDALNALRVIIERCRAEHGWSAEQPSWRNSSTSVGWQPQASSAWCCFLLIRKSGRPGWRASSWHAIDAGQSASRRGPSRSARPLHSGVVRGFRAPFSRTSSGGRDSAVWRLSRTIWQRCCTASPQFAARRPPASLRAFACFRGWRPPCPTSPTRLP